MKDRLTRDFYSRSPLKVARDLLGKYLVHNYREGRITRLATSLDARRAKRVGKIVETEAYLGNDDPACHTYKGRITERNKMLFAEPGHAYIYTIYGMYYCFNIVAHEKGKSGGVFIRAVEPIEGKEIILKRQIKNKIEIEKTRNPQMINLTNGPGKLCIAFGIDKNLNGADLCGNKLFVTNRKNIPDSQIARTARINIDYAGKAKYLPYRFIIKGSAFLSRK